MYVCVCIYIYIYIYIYICIYNVKVFSHKKEGTWGTFKMAEE